MLVLGSMLKLIDLDRENKYDCNLYYAAEFAGDNFLYVLNKTLEESIKEIELQDKNKNKARENQEDKENNQEQKTQEKTEIEIRETINNMLEKKIREKNLYSKITLTIKDLSDISNMTEQKNNKTSNYEITMRLERVDDKLFKLTSTAQNLDTKNKAELIFKYKTTDDFKKFDLISSRYKNKDDV